jgi:hypothetical protein
MTFGPGDAFPPRMSAKTGLVAALVGGLLLHASGARADDDALEPLQFGGDQPAAVPAAPTVQPIPPASDAPPRPVPGLRPALEPQPAAPVPAPSPVLTAPRMIHKPRPGLVLAGVAILIPAYVVQLLMPFGYSPTIQTYDQPCSYCEKAQALSLVPIVGPWLAAREAGTPNDTGMLLFGGVEAAAATMLIVGLIGHDVPEEPKASKVSLAPFVTPESGGMSLRLRW